MDALLCNPGQEPEVIPICFEIVEEATIPESMDETEPHAQDAIPEIMDETESHAPQDAMPEMPPTDDAIVKEVETAEDEDIADTPEPINEQTERQADETAQPESTAAVQDDAKEERAKIVSDPVALNRIVPSYPRSARRKGHEGSVTVEITVAADGMVNGAEIVGSSGHAELDAAALDAARTARFAPATVDGVTVSGRLRLTFDFRLK